MQPEMWGDRLETREAPSGIGGRGDEVTTGPDDSWRWPLAAGRRAAVNHRGYSVVDGARLIECHVPRERYSRHSTGGDGGGERSWV